MSRALLGSAHPSFPLSLPFPALSWPQRVRGALQSLAAWMGGDPTGAGVHRQAGARSETPLALAPVSSLRRRPELDFLLAEMEGGVVLTMPRTTGVQRMVIEFQHRGEALAWARGWPQTSLGAWWEARWRHASEARGWAVEALHADHHRTRVLVRTRRAGPGVVAATLAAAIQWPRHAPAPRVESVPTGLEVDLPSFAWETAEPPPAAGAASDGR